MDEFSALIASFSEQLVGHIGSGNATAVLLRPYAGSETVDVLIRLSENTWANQLRTMEKLDAVRLMYLGELSFEYRFLADGESEPDVHEPTAGYQLVKAA